MAVIVPKKAKLIEARLKLGMTATKLAYSIPISFGIIEKLENGELETVSSFTASQIAEKLNKNIEDIFHVLEDEDEEIKLKDVLSNRKELDSTFDELLTITEISERLKISKTTIYRLRKQGLPALKVGKSLRFNEKQVIEWLLTKGYTNEDNDNSK